MVCVFQNKKKKARDPNVISMSFLFSLFLRIENSFQKQEPNRSKDSYESSMSWACLYDAQNTFNGYYLVEGQNTTKKPGPVRYPKLQDSQRMN